MANENPNTQADGEAWDPSRFPNHGAEISAALAERDRQAGVGKTYECSYCGSFYTKKDARQVLCLRCTVEDYL